MSFTIEQLEKIISDAPKFDCGYYKLTEIGVLFGGNTNGIDGWLPIGNLVMKLEEMKMKESQSMRPEFDNTAQQVESLAKTNNTEMQDSSEWDGEGLPPVGCKIKVAEGVGTVLSTSEKLDGVVTYSVDDGLSIYCAWNNKSWVNPILTKEQKQQKIDEQNGELLFKVMNSVFKMAAYDFADGDKANWSKASKLVSFKGKLESI